MSYLICSAGLLFPGRAAAPSRAFSLLYARSSQVEYSCINLNPPHALLSTLLRIAERSASPAAPRQGSCARWPLPQAAAAEPASWLRRRAPFAAGLSRASCQPPLPPLRLQEQIANTCGGVVSVEAVDDCCSMALQVANASLSIPVLGLPKARHLLCGSPHSTCEAHPGGWIGHTELFLEAFLSCVQLPIRHTKTTISPGGRRRLGRREAPRGGRTPPAAAAWLRRRLLSAAGFTARLPVSCPRRHSVADQLVEAPRRQAAGILQRLQHRVQARGLSNARKSSTYMSTFSRHACWLMLQAAHVLQRLQHRVQAHSLP